jgi:hypothetical protein
VLEQQELSVMVAVEAMVVILVALIRLLALVALEFHQVVVVVERLVALQITQQVALAVEDL